MNFRFAILITFLFLVSHIPYSQSITGTITDASTESPLRGANITVSPGNTGTVSAMDGTFKIFVPEPGKYTINCSFVGYFSEEKTVKTDSKTVIINFQLMPAPHPIGEVVIEGQITGPVKRAGDALYTGTAITTHGISLMGASASNSVYNSLAIMPGITIEGNDPYGLSEKTVRIRGIRSTFSGMTIEGFPNYGIMPIGARDYIYDMENMKSVSVYKGAAPSDLGTATGSKGGVVELKYNKPADSVKVGLKQAGGSSSYLRSFARIDMGKLRPNSKAFISLSRTRADKWKGPGTLGPRYNAAFGITQNFENNTTIEVFGNYNIIDRHHFKELSYQEASDIANNYDKDFSSSQTGIPDQDLNYYNYNKGEYINRDLMAMASHRFSPAVKIQLKGYVSSEDADYNESVKRASGNFVLNRMRDINRAGIIPEMHGRSMGYKYTLGYWYESSDNNAYVFNSRIVPTGLEMIGYGYYTRKADLSKIHSPYLKVANTIGRFRWQAGLKYFHYREPAGERFTSDSPDELSDAPDINLQTDAMTYQAFLPSLGLGFHFSNKLQAYINYGRNYMRPYMYSPIISLYINNIDAFLENNIALQTIFDSWDMETSDNIDLGIRYTTDQTSVSSSIFVARHYDVLASVYNPEVGINYYQNAGEMTAYGAELECYIKPVKSLTLVFNPGWISMSYDKNIERNGETIKIKGNQSPATPKFSLKTGMIFSKNNVNASVLVKHTGKRYGDATNSEEIDEYTIANINCTYEIGAFSIFKSIHASMEIRNILDTKYVSAINASDDSSQGNATYFAGSPRSFIGSVQVIF